MPAPLDLVESQWLAQLTEMRQATADLKLDRHDIGALEHDRTLDLGENDSLGGSGLDDIWDVPSDQDLSDVSSMLSQDGDVVHPDPAHQLENRELSWLQHAVEAFAGTTPDFDAEDLFSRLLNMLTSDIKGTRMHTST